MPIYNANNRASDSVIRCVIFDMDGLLLDTEQIYTDAMREVVNAYGKDFDMSFKAQIIGLPASESAEYTVAELNLPISAEVYLNKRNKLLKQRFAAARSKPGAKELVAHLHRCKIPMAVATSSPRELLELKTRNHQDWFGAFAHILSVEDKDILNGKPEPDVYLAAAHKLGFEPHQCLAFEDSPAGVRSARAAGMPVIAVPELDPGHPDFLAANQVISSLQDFKPQVWGLPLFQDSR